MEASSSVLVMGSGTSCGVSGSTLSSGDEAIPLSLTNVGKSSKIGTLSSQVTHILAKINYNNK